MLDGRVLEASQVEYKPFGKTPLKRESGRRQHPLNKWGWCEFGAAEQVADACVH